jgi:hypothetical protein
MLQAYLTKELDILCRMMSNPKKTHSHGKYDEFASEAIMVCDKKIAQIQHEINNLKKGLTH